MTPTSPPSVQRPKPWDAPASSTITRSTPPSGTSSVAGHSSTASTVAARAMRLERTPAHHDRGAGASRVQRRAATGLALDGIPGSNLVDVDLDCDEAVQLAPNYLPATPAIWGRPGNPMSHLLYQITPTDAPTQLLKLTDPEQRSSWRCEARRPNARDLHAAAIHPRDERRALPLARGREPARLPWDDLVTPAKTLAAAALLLRAYPSEAGGRNDFAKHLAGMLAHAGWREDRIVRFLQPILEAAHDDVEDRLRDAVLHTVEQHQREKPVTGAPTLVQLLGRPPSIACASCSDSYLDRDHRACGPREPGLVFERASDLLAQPDVAQPWVIEQQLPVGGLGLLVGYPKSGARASRRRTWRSRSRGGFRSWGDSRRPPAPSSTSPTRNIATRPGVGGARWARRRRIPSTSPSPRTSGTGSRSCRRQWPARPNRRCSSSSTRCSSSSA